MREIPIINTGNVRFYGKMDDFELKTGVFQ